MTKDNIPKIDLILISHDQYDHLDYNSLKYFKKRDNPKILAGLEVGKVDRDLNITETKLYGEAFTLNLKI